MKTANWCKYLEYRKILKISISNLERKMQKTSFLKLMKLLRKKYLRNFLSWRLLYWWHGLAAKKSVFNLFTEELETDFRLPSSINLLMGRDLLSQLFWVLTDSFLEDSLPSHGHIQEIGKLMLMPSYSHWHIRLSMRNIKIPEMQFILQMVLIWQHSEVATILISLILPTRLQLVTQILVILTNHHKDMLLFQLEQIPISMEAQ